MFVPGGWWHAV
jgi:histone arginine demethylase JMJD6